MKNMFCHMSKWFSWNHYDAITKLVVYNKEKETRGLKDNERRKENIQFPR